MVIARLRAAIKRDRLPHALLFAGPAKSGKHTVGLALAAAVNCERDPGEGCGECASCQRITHGLHPDVRTLERKGAAQIIPIETIRKEIVAAVGLPPHEAKRRFFLIEEATSLKGPAANALLKTLEEPPPRTHFILGTVSADKLLPTIRSRCQKLVFGALATDIRTQLATDPRTQPADGQDDMHTKLDKLSDVLLAAAETSSPLPAIFSAAQEVSSQRSEVAPTLRLVSEKLHQRAREAVKCDQLDIAASCARRASLVLDTELAVTLHNAHGQLAIETLLTQLRAVR